MMDVDNIFFNCAFEFFNTKKKNRNKWMEVQQSPIARQMSDVWGDYDSAVVKQYVQGTMTANNRAM